jgi:ABC-type glycerol-3-phosphate transport system substrate-binding protein
LVLLYVVIKVLIPAVTNKSGKVVTLNYWGLWEDSSLLEGVIADFEAKNPDIKVNYKTQQKNDYRSRLSGRLSKDPTVEEIPDIFRLHSSWLPMFSDNLAPVPDTTAKSIGLDSDYYAVYKHDLKVSNRYLAIPLMYDGLSLFYNQDLIEKSQATLPKTWWDLQTISSNLTVLDSNGRLKVAGVAMGLTDNVDHWNDIVGILLRQNGADITKNDQENNDKIRDVLSYYANFATQYKTWDESMPSSTQAFAEGKLVFYFAPSWRVFNIEELNPSLRFAITTVPQLATLQTQSASTPTSDADLTNIHWASYWVEGVNSKSDHQKEAWKFLEYLSTKEVLEKMFTAASQTRSFGEIYPRISMGTSLSGNAKIKPFISVANDAESGYLSSRTFDAGLNTELSKYFADAINSIALKSADPSSIMTDLRLGIDQIIQKYHLK